MSRLRTGSCCICINDGDPFYYPVADIHKYKVINGGLLHFEFVCCDAKLPRKRDGEWREQRRIGPDYVRMIEGEVVNICDRCFLSFLMGAPGSLDHPGYKPAMINQRRNEWLAHLRHAYDECYCHT